MGQNKVHVKPIIFMLDSSDWRVGNSSTMKRWNVKPNSVEITAKDRQNCVKHFSRYTDEFVNTSPY